MEYTRMNWPKVSIVITTYKEATKPYLDLAVESVKNLSYPKDKLEVIIVAREGYEPRYEGVRTVFPPQKEFYNPLGCNFGVRECAADSEYVFLLNDDVICTKDCLQPLVSHAVLNNGNCVLIPIGNCHLGWRYSLVMGYQDQSDLPFTQLTQRFARINDWLPIKDKLMNTGSVYPPGLILENSLCLYAALFPKKIFESVGYFDEQFTVGQDDIDFCLRAKQAGYVMGICLQSLVWHFGGVTTSERPDNLRQENIERFKNKWGFSPTLGYV